MSSQIELLKSILDPSIHDEIETSHALDQERHSFDIEFDFVYHERPMDSHEIFPQQTAMVELSSNNLLLLSSLSLDATPPLKSTSVFDESTTLTPSTPPLTTTVDPKHVNTFPSLYQSYISRSSTSSEFDNFVYEDSNGYYDNNSISSFDDESTTLNRGPSPVTKYDWHMNAEFNSAIATWIKQNEEAKKRSLAEASRIAAEKAAAAETAPAAQETTVASSSALPDVVAASRPLTTATATSTITSRRVSVSRRRKSESNLQQSRSTSHSIHGHANSVSGPTSRSARPTYTEDQKPFKCPSCDKSFRRTEHLKRHVRSVHSLVRPYECPHCDKKFSRSDNLAQHVKVHNRD